MASCKKRGNSFLITSYQGYSSNGKQIAKTMTWKPSPDMTPKQIEKELERQKILFDEQCQNGLILDGNITFAAFSDKWFNEYAKKQLAPKTLVRYQDHMERILPAIGHIKLRQLRRTHIISLYNNLSEPGLRKDIRFLYTGKQISVLINDRKISKTKLANDIGVHFDTINYLLDGKTVTESNAHKVSEYFNIPISKLFKPIGADKPLSNRTIQSHGKLLKAMLHKAVEWGYIPVNPADGAPLPKIEYKEAHYLTEEDEKKILLLLDTTPTPPKYRIAIIVAMFTGMRLGEICGLEWHDIDFSRCAISVVRSSQYVTGQGIITKMPKNKSSIRTNIYGKYLFDELKKYKAIQAQERLQMGDLWHDSDRLFTKDDGTPIYPGSIEKWLQKFRANADLPPFTMHSLRHSYASILIASNQLDVETISCRMGHSQTSTTLNIYSHLFTSKDKQAANIMDNALIQSN